MNRYAWIQAKITPKVHRVNINGCTYCKAENVSNRLSFGSSPPTKAHIDCKICIQLQSKEAMNIGQDPAEEIKYTGYGSTLRPLVY